MAPKVAGERVSSHPRYECGSKNRILRAEAGSARRPVRVSPSVLPWDDAGAVRVTEHVEATFAVRQRTPAIASAVFGFLVVAC